VHTTYVSQLLRIPPGTLNEGALLSAPRRAGPPGCFVRAMRMNTRMFTVFGMAGQEPPRDLAGMLSSPRVTPRPTYWRPCGRPNHSGRWHDTVCRPASERAL